MDLKKLKEEMPFKWRVQSATQYGASCVAYIDARDVQDKLDEVCGPENWCVKYNEHKGNLFASIGIKCQEDYDGFVFKEDCGTESNVEKQKGEASDAFKRAGVMWGIGRFLYSKKIVKIKEVGKDSKGRFFPTQNGQKIWDITKYCNDLQGNNPTLTQSVEKTLQKTKLTAKGVHYLKDNPDKIPEALETREMTTDQRTYLKSLIK